MKSKTSFFNLTLFCKNIKRFWPLWGLPSIGVIIGAVIFYIAGMVEEANGHQIQISKVDAIDAYYEVLVHFVPIWSMIFAMFAAMAVWNYMYSSKSVGMMHSIPIRRSGIFFTNFLSGMTMMAIPYLVAAIMLVPYISAHGGKCPGAVCITILGVIAESFFFFSFATLTGQVVGTTVVLPILYVVFNFLQIIVAFFVKLLISLFVYGYTYSLSVRQMIFVPVVYIFANVKLEKEYIGHTDEAYGYWETLGDISLSNGKVIVYYAIAGVVLTALSLLLYTRRKSESAGETISFIPVKKFLLYLFSGIAGFGAGYLLYTIYTEAVYSYMDAVKPFRLIVCCLIMGAISFYLAQMALNKTLKVFNRKSLFGYLGLSAAYVILIVIFALDIFHISSRIPKLSDIKSVTVNTGIGDIYIKDSTDPDVIEKIYEYNRLIMENADSVKEDTLRSYADSNTVRGLITISYNLKNGMHFEREYGVWLTQENVYKSGTVAKVFYDINGDRDLIAESLILSKEQPVYACFYNYVSEFTSALSTDDKEIIDKLKNAVIADVLSRSEPRFMEMLRDSYGNAVGYLSFDYYGSKDGYLKSESMPVTLGMVNTIQVLIDEGHLNRKDVEKGVYEYGIWEK